MELRLAHSGGHALQDHLQAVATMAADFARSQAGELVLLTMYAKSNTETLKASTLKELRDAFDQ